jgi:hypothetical protein
MLSMGDEAREAYKFKDFGETWARCEGERAADCLAVRKDWRKIIFRAATEVEDAGSE